ncbi:uncharacterized protein PGTG_06553 [Puccinia graminis f. sp. tritici CRL 75-36-700-3]|uniref:Uncharacterized protein n=1 Tax=Puccinia graminis f. sp. tritici (strain CRL 75-36-700-3 / race SCCL) TaxID=418459 RepID=E3K8F7_PUCGT|nr:uncharacterized protein PGTG_06553 [Puccinia graminis f. sp. tritici CRL 75-36-700-3]EFP80597.2 hypothetical protein PGTG_06553 [Puccinia graminis f. sp. tritici CRL 75-36-700-3]
MIISVTKCRLILGVVCYPAVQDVLARPGLSRESHEIKPLIDYFHEAKPSDPVSEFQASFNNGFKRKRPLEDWHPFPQQHSWPDPIAQLVNPETPLLGQDQEKRARKGIEHEFISDGLESLVSANTFHPHLQGMFGSSSLQDDTNKFPMWENIKKLAQPDLHQEDSHASNALVDNYNEGRLSVAVSELQAIVDGRNDLRRPLQDDYRPQEPLSSTNPIGKVKLEDSSIQNPVERATTDINSVAGSGGWENVVSEGMLQSSSWQGEESTMGNIRI